MISRTLSRENVASLEVIERRRVVLFGQRDQIPFSFNRGLAFELETELASIYAKSVPFGRYGSVTREPQRRSPALLEFARGIDASAYEMRDVSSRDVRPRRDRVG